MRDPVLLFDVFRTLLAFDGDHVDAATFEHLATWLGYRGVHVDGPALQRSFETTTRRHLDASPSRHPDVDVRRVWTELLAALPTWREPRADLVDDLTLEYRQVTTRSISLWPGTEDMLDACAGVRLAIASNTQRAYTDTELRMLGIHDRFEVIVFSSDVLACKPDPAVFHAALRALDVGPDEVVYLGDAPYDDVVGATAAGIATVLLERGTPAPPGVALPEPLARVRGDDPVTAVRLARRHLGVPA